jgi:hypothetical protein
MILILKSHFEMVYVFERIVMSVKNHKVALETTYRFLFGNTAEFGGWSREIVYRQKYHKKFGIKEDQSWRMGNYYKGRSIIFCIEEYGARIQEVRMMYQFLSSKFEDRIEKGEYDPKIKSETWKVKNMREFFKIERFLKKEGILIEKWYKEAFSEDNEDKLMEIRNELRIRLLNS